jgi:hypothetical protein
MSDEGGLDASPEGNDGSSEGGDSSCSGDCGATDGATDAGDSGGPSGDASDSGGAPHFVDGGLTLQCWNDPEYVIGPLDTSCTSVADCAVVSHISSCCGDLTEYGINTSAVAQYQAENANCAGPACTCMGQGPYAQDGAAATAGKSIGVKCATATCTTYIQ